MSETAIERENAQREDDTPVLDRDVRHDAALSNPIGLIGLQDAGIGAALRLRAAGHAVLACDEHQDRRDAYAQQAGSAAPCTAHPGELALLCNTILLFLGLGEDTSTIHAALIDALPSGSLIVDLGPNLPGETRRIAAELEGKGLRLVDAVILATTPVAVLVGGADADVALAAPVLSALGHCELTGAVGSAQALSALLAELDEMPDLPRIRSLI